MPEEVIAEEEQQEQTSQESDVLGMSDEDLMNMAEPSVGDTDESDSVPAAEDNESDAEDEATDEEETVEENTEVVTEGDNEETPSKKAKDDDKSDEGKDTELDYKAEYDRLIAPFRANGKDIQVHSVDDAITLMQQGANYNKKMAGLKPNLKLMKMLENNELLDENKLSFLIDLNKKNPEAVQKFIKDSGIDPLDIDTEKATEYTPNTYTVDDNEVELDTVLDNIRDTQSFNETIDVISNKWDASSKKILLEKPEIISVINEHVGSGIYAQISNVVESERMLGRLKGLSDLEAYRKVGDAIQSVNGFTGQTAPEPLQQVEKPTNTNKKPKDDPKLKNRKRAASSTKSTPNKKVDPNFNPLSMSDEEFEKSISSQYM